MGPRRGEKRGEKKKSPLVTPGVRDVIDEDTMVEIEEEENLSELSVTQLKKRMKERGIEASGCTEVTGTPTLARTPCLTAATPRAPTP